MRRSRALILSLGLAGLAAGAVVAQTAPETSAPPPQPAPPQVTPAPIPSLPDVAPPPEPAPEIEDAPETTQAAREPEPAPEPKPPMKRARYDVAVIQALDKISAETIRFEAPVGQPIRYKSLVFTVRACELAAPDEQAPDAIAYLTIDSQPRPRAGLPTPAPRQAYRGWMYAASPALHPLEHPVYDAWLITCRASAPASGG
ncbi:DUF2155 domain-containing protein [Phenylobacterium sp.]|uniref:DUF2155 domain-containing protein n=1 Tax=Phenylobacterium sp. TaxID=1871053 RepID=UPI002730A06C|nr:DUF2155 domain-containing protein [Phenylobacterium sp.]MDP1616429.1 DUF2155 domain-containing protein [Phenylobacterium sp.]MDP1986710.1 DUF2155 domain-containing protein [Phenylobacterium sp.]